jgi:hypothetical protein
MTIAAGLLGTVVPREAAKAETATISALTLAIAVVGAVVLASVARPAEQAYTITTGFALSITIAIVRT